MSTVRIQLRRGLANDWTSADPTLAAGEVGLESDTGKFKFGDGSTAWITLPYALENTLGDYVLISEVGSANGVASLNSSGKVPASQLDITELSQDAVDLALTAGNGIAKAYNDASNTLTISLTDDIILSGYADVDQIIANSAQIDGELTADSVTISGNLVVNGTFSSVPTETLVVENPMIYLAEGNPANSLDIGLVGSHTISSTYSHTGLVKDATDGIWKLFSGVVTEPGNTVDFTTWTKDNLQVGELYANAIYMDNVTNTEIGYLNGVSSNIQDQLDDKLDIATASSSYAPIVDPSFSGTVSGITKAMVGLSSVDDTPDLSKPISTATQEALDLKADLSGPTFTGTVILPSTTSIGEVSATEIGYVNGATSSIQTQLNQKTTDLENHALDTTSIHGIADTAELATKTYADSAVSTHSSDSTNIHGIADTAALATKTYADGKASDAQTAAQNYADSAVSTHSSDTTSVHGITDTSALATKTYADDAVSTHSSDTTSVHGITDTSKLVVKDAVSTTLDGALIVSGDFTVNGTNFAASATTITIEDNLIQLAHQNSANSVDLGLVVAYTDGTTKHSGIVRDVSDSTWKLFKDVATEPTTVVAFGEGSLDNLAVNNLAAAGVVFTDGTQTKEGVASRTPIIQKTSSYTLSNLTERDSLIEVSSSSATTITIPLNSTIAYPVGTSIDVLQTSTGQVTIAGAGGVTVNATPGLKLRTQWSSATLFKRAENVWVVMGDLSA